MTDVAERRGTYTLIKVVERDALKARIEALETALREIAEQLLTDELPEGFRDGDYEYAYEQAVRVARAALAEGQDK